MTRSALLPMARVDDYHGLSRSVKANTAAMKPRSSRSRNLHTCRALRLWRGLWHLWADTDSWAGKIRCCV